MYRSSLSLIAALLLPLIALSACGEKKPAEADKSSAPASPAVADADAKNPCAYLTAAEVEAVLGPLAGPPYRANHGVANPKGEACRYETAALRAIEVSIDWKDGGQTFGVMNMVQGVVDKGGLKGVFKTQDGTTLTGEWDEARLNLCCEFAALRGEQLVTVNIGASRATVEQAAKLADAAVRRLDSPLATDTTDGDKAALAREALRPKARPACALLTRAEAEAIIGSPLSADPVGNEDACTYAWAKGGLEQQIKLNVQWRGGFSEMRFAQAAMGQALSFMKSQGLDAAPEKGKSAALDEDVTNIVGVMAVKKDVLFSSETGPFMADLAHALIVKAASKL
ncbi:MAG: hypothetical protein K8S25_11215 [Alphaproteobacteria bacterium]|nr:hypothetical protein [Alphaproteobacteria bacterium]